MERRTVLASAASLSTAALLAGCTGYVDGADDSTETTRGESAVSEVWVGRSFRYLYAGAHVNAYTVTGDGPIFVFALAENGAQPALSLDGATHDPAGELPGSTGADAVFFDRDTEQRRVVTYSLTGPVDASAGSVGGRTLSDDALAFLADPAAFSVSSVSVPDSARKGSHATVTVTARNGGGTAGTFRAAATSQSISAFDVGKVTVEPGGRASVELEVPVNGEGEERVDVTWGSDGVERTVSVES